MTSTSTPNSKMIMESLPAILVAHDTSTPMETTLAVDAVPRIGSTSTSLSTRAGVNTTWVLPQAKVSTSVNMAGTLLEASWATGLFWSTSRYVDSSPTLSSNKLIFLGSHLWFARLYQRYEQ